jgi:NitT/TauT family transport system permease protein
VDRAKAIIYPLITFAVFVIAWEAAIVYFEVPNYIVPRPAVVAQSFLKGYLDGSLWPHLFFTIQSIVCGYLLGCSVAFLFGALLAESRTAELFLYPYIVALKSTPKVALAPLIIVWFGFGIESKIVMVALVCFFPVFVNTLIGLRQADKNQIDLMRVYSASRLHILLNVKLPSALGVIFAGLQIAVVLGLIGAIVAEFISSRQGLGYVISSNSFDMNLGMMFAAIVSLSIIGVIGSSLVRYAQSKIVFWEAEGRNDSVITDIA